MFDQIFDNLYVLYPAKFSSNAYLLVGKKIVLIDTGLAQNEPYLKEFLSALSISPNEINLILHTHGHADHYEADRIFPKAEIMMHRKDAEKVNSHDPIFTCSELLNGSYFPKISSFLSDGQKLKIEPFDIEVIHTPGHSAGSVCFYEKKKKLLFSGDTIFKAAVGRYDLAGSSKNDLIDSIHKLSKLKVDMLLPGHGKVLSEKLSDNFEFAINQMSAYT
jgi:glyoxylase-like metal-dependent hydrolase (beta-lactamase superfamily II)